ncbi:MAG: hypothetical protein E7505_08895 [Ruminococcus sp.]|nr:hypothetical protein [Ruminococcus sp.]
MELYNNFNRTEEKKKVLLTEDDINRLSQYAGQISKMFAEVKKDKPLERLLLAAGMAGHACHLAVKHNRERFEIVGYDDGRKFYFGDALNFYLLENKYSVYYMLMGYYDRQMAGSGGIGPDMREILAENIKNISNTDYRISGKYDPKDIYKEVTECWNGIYDNMTGKWCKNPDEWPVLFGIVLQLTLFRISAPPEELVKKALECLMYISKMDEDSLNTGKPASLAEEIQKAVKEGDVEKAGNELIYRFFDSANNIIPLDEAQQKFLKEGIDTAREFFKENEIPITLSSDSNEMSKTMEFKISIAGEVTTVWFKVCMKPLLFSIVFFIPYKANPLKINQVCTEICKMNFGRPTGSFHIDPSDGQILNISSFPCYNGMSKDNLIMLFIHNMKIVAANMSKFKEFSE